MQACVCESIDGDVMNTMFDLRPGWLSPLGLDFVLIRKVWQGQVKAQEEGGRKPEEDDLSRQYKHPFNETMWILIAESRPHSCKTFVRSPKIHFELRVRATAKACRGRNPARQCSRI